MLESCTHKENTIRKDRTVWVDSIDNLQGVASKKSRRKCASQGTSSNVSFRRATLRGVFALLRPSGVFHGFCAGLGVMCTKSEKSKPIPGVLGLKRLPPPGVVIMDEGSASLIFFAGGVDGGSIRLLGGLAGDGEAAR